MMRLIELYALAIKKYTVFGTFFPCERGTIKRRNPHSPCPAKPNWLSLSTWCSITAKTLSFP